MLETVKKSKLVEENVAKGLEDLEKSNCSSGEDFNNKITSAEGLNSETEQTPEGTSLSFSDANKCKTADQLTDEHKVKASQKTHK